MKKSLRLIIKCFLLYFVLQAFNSSYYPDDRVQEFIKRANYFCLRFPQEKIYLQIDKSSYLATEEIWFKAYILNSAIPECNLYIELLNSSGAVVLKNIAWCQNGLAYGDFLLADTISTGVYQLRAYTNWMRNFDNSCFFHKDLIIWNLADKEIAPKPEILKADNIDIQFFPEGGSFVANLNNRVAFKSADKNGKGIEIEGEVFDDKGNKITSFKSLKKGMGSFELVPDAKLKYEARIQISGGYSKSINLPEVQSGRVAMRLESNDESIKLQISEDQIATDVQETYFLVGRARGLVFYQKEIILKNGTINMDIDKAKMPTGITQFTLFGKDFIPLCERLIFVNNHDFINVKIYADKSNYRPREKVNIALKTLNERGLPSLSNLSISVISPKSLLKIEDYPDNILSHFLLGSELKGRIEDPSFYFKDDSLSTLTALDNLMLTQGYRYFSWNEIRENLQPEILYPPEECIQVRGIVKSVLLNKPVPNSKVTMMTSKSLLSVDEEKTDSSGKFLFTNLYFYDTISVILQAVGSTGKRNSYIELDNKSSVSPVVDNLPAYYQYFKETPLLTTTYLNELRTDLINKKWHLSDTIMLGDVSIVARKREKDDGHFRTYSDADFVFDMSKQDDIAGNVYDAIDGRIPGVRLEVGENIFMYRGIPILIYLDGIPVRDNMLSTFSSRSFDKIELIRNAAEVGINYPGGILYFYTKRGKFENLPTESLGIKGTRVIGYSIVRGFYSPSYDDPDREIAKGDYRITQYWNPLVKTDSTGTAQVSFYNSDEAGNMEIIVEGITADGRLCRGIGSYVVRY